MKTDKQNYNAIPDTAARPMVEREHEKAQKYAGMLQHTAERMMALADQLSTGGRELKSEERELLRMATLPAMREMFHEVMVLFVAGENPVGLPPFQEIAQLCDDLTKAR